MDSLSNIVMAKGKHLAKAGISSNDIRKEDPEVKHSLKSNIPLSRTTKLDKLKKISSWSNMKRVVAMFKFKDMLLDIIKPYKINTTGQLLDMNLLKKR